MNRLRDLMIDGVPMALLLHNAAYRVHKMSGVLVALMLGLLGMGVFSRSGTGRRVAETLEQLVLSKIPGCLMIKSIAADFGSGEREEGLRPVLVSFDDNQALGFMVEGDDATDRVAVFLPGSPSLAGGNVVVGPSAQVQLLDASLGQLLVRLPAR